MAELHANQIAFQAGDTAKANIAAPKDYMSDALRGLADVADSAAEHMVALEDNLLDQSIRSQLKATKKMIDDAKSLDADYSELRNQAIGEFNSILNGAPEAARRRYLQRYPTVMRDTIMLIDAEIATKVGDQIYTRLNNEIPRMSSEIITSAPEMQEALYNESMALLNNPNLSIAQVENLTQQFRSQVDKGRVLTAISGGDWKTARLLLDNPEATASISAPERASMYNSLAAGMKREQEELAEKFKLEKEAKEGSQKAVLQRVVLDTYKTMIDAGRYADAEAFRSDVFSGRPILAGDGTVLGSTNMWGAEFQSELSGKMSSIAKNDPNMSTRKAVTQSEYFDIVRPALNKDGNIDVAMVTPEIYNNAERFRQNKYTMNYLLDENQRDQLTEMASAYPAAAVEAFAPVDAFGAVKLSVREPRAKKFHEGVSPIGNTVPVVDKYISGKMSGLPLSIRSAYPVGEEAAAKQSVAESLQALKERGFMAGVKDGTRAYAVYANLVGLASTDESSVQQSLINAGFGSVPIDVVMSAVLRTVGELQGARLADDNPTSADIQSDFNRVYELATGRQNNPDENTKKIQDGLFNFALAATLHPDDVSVRTYRNSLKIEDKGEKGGLLYPDYEFYNAFNALPAGDEKYQKERRESVTETRKKL